MNAPTKPIDVLEELRSGGQRSLDQVFALTYQELRAIAHRRLVARGPGGTLSTTALVHEAYLKLVDQSRAGWQDLAHFHALASLAGRSEQDAGLVGSDARSRGRRPYKARPLPGTLRATGLVRSGLAASPKWEIR